MCVVRVVAAVLSAFLLAASASAAFLVGCRNNAPQPSASDDGSARGSVTTDGESASSDDDAAAHIVRTVEARAEEARRDAGTIPPACEAMAMSLVLAALDVQCALPEREWALLVDGGAAASAGAGAAVDTRGLRQIARRATPQGEEPQSVVLSLVNMGLVPVVVPLRIHPDRPEQAFSVLAEDDKHAVFELAPPTFERSVRHAIEALRADGGAGAAGGADVPRPVRRSALNRADSGASLRVHSARIRLPPGGTARVGLVVDARIVKRIDRSCAADAGAECMPPRLPKGRYTLHLGQLIADIDAGPPARVEWDVP